MNIAVFQNLPPGGGKRTIYEQVKGLIKRGHVVDVYQLAHSNSNFCDLKSLGCPVHEFVFSKSGQRLVADWKNFVSLRILHHRIADQINRKLYDLALVHPDMYTESPFVLRHLDVPNVYFCQELLRIGYEPELAFNEPVGFIKTTYENLTRKIRVAIDKKNAQSAQKIITTSHFIQRNVQSAYRKPSFVCRLGVDPKTFKPYPAKRSKVIFIGSKTSIGGYDFVQQISQLTNIEIISYGFSSKGADVNNDKTLAQAYSQSFACLCVSGNEPFGLKALESMACETPVLAVNEGGYRETVIDSVTGWLLTRDPKIFAAKINYLQKHPEVVKKMGKAGRDHVIKNFTWDRHIDQLEKILFKISKTQIEHV